MEVQTKQVIPDIAQIIAQAMIGTSVIYPDLFKGKRPPKGSKHIGDVPPHLKGLKAKVVEFELRLVNKKNSEEVRRVLAENIQILNNVFVRAVRQHIPAARSPQDKNVKMGIYSGWKVYHFKENVTAARPPRNKLN